MAKFARERENQIEEDNERNAQLLESLRIDVKNARIREEQAIKKAKDAISVPGVVSDNSHLTSVDDGETINTVFSSVSAVTTNTLRGISPESLHPYPVRKYPISMDNVSATNIEVIFRQSYSLAAMVSVGGQATVPQGRTLGRDLLADIAINYAEDTGCTRFFIQNAEETHALVIDILGVKICPSSLVHNSYREHDWSALKAGDRDQFPLLLVRYNYSTKAMFDNPVVLKEFQTEYFKPVSGTSQGNYAATSNAIIEAAKYLKDKELLLSDAHVAEFGKRNNMRVFRPSFIIPMAMDEREMKKEEGCCSLEGCSNPGWAVSVVLFVL
jgi:hypothetical protein